MPGPASYFDYADLDRLPADTASLVARRRESMGAAYRLFYAEPVEIVRGTGTRLFDAAGDEYLDAYNNVPTVGHAHPEIVAAICAQAGRLNTHTRYLDDAIVSYSEDLLRTLPGPLDNIMYTCTGSEANDLALRIAKFTTGARGVIVTTEAYHGITTETAAISPSLGGPESIGDWVELISAPKPGTSAAEFADAVTRAVANLAGRGHRPAAIIFDTIFASDGVLTPPANVVAAGTDVVKQAGGLLIADEVQAGFGRLGQGMWGFETIGLAPDLITLGKPMGSGQPIAAVVGRHELIDDFGARTRYFSTFAGNSVSIAAAAATLDVIRAENLIPNADATGEVMRAGLASLARRHQHLGEVRGSGLFLGIDIVEDSYSKRPADVYAFDIVNGMRRRHVLTAAVGAGRNTLKVRPPLPFDEDDAGWFLNALDSCLTDLPFRT